jgi:hypothetical protein
MIGPNTHRNVVSPLGKDGLHPSLRVDQAMFQSWCGASLVHANEHIIYTSVACAIGPSVTMSSTDFSFQNLVFWNLFEFSAAEIT